MVNIKNNLELVKMSAKGQLVVPLDIRSRSKLTPGERFAAFPIKEGVLFKKIEMPKIKISFESLSKEIEAQFNENNIKEKEINEAVKWARKK